MNSLVEKEQVIRALREEIAEIKSSLPVHSVSAAVLQHLEELEELLAELEREGEDA